MKKMLLVIAMVVTMMSSFTVCSASSMKEENQWGDWYWAYSNAQCSVYVDKNVGVRYDDGNVYVWVKTAYADGTESVSRMRYSVDENGRYKASLGSSVHYDENGAIKESMYMNYRATGYYPAESIILCQSTPASIGGW